MGRFSSDFFPVFDWESDWGNEKSIHQKLILSKNAQYRAVEFRHCQSWYHASERQYIWHYTPFLYSCADTKHTTDIAVIRSAKWGTLGHIYKVRVISKHKNKYVIGNVSGSTHKLFATWPIAKIKSITPMLISNPNYPGWWDNHQQRQWQLYCQMSLPVPFHGNSHKVNHHAQGYDKKHNHWHCLST